MPKENPEERIDKIEEKLEEEITQIQEQINNLAHRLKTLEAPVHKDLGPREKQIVHTLHDSQEPITSRQIAEKLDTNSTNIRAILNKLKTKIDLKIEDSGQQGGAKKYQLEDSVRDKLNEQ